MVLTKTRLLKDDFPVHGMLSVRNVGDLRDIGETSGGPQQNSVIFCMALIRSGPGKPNQRKVSS